MLTKEPKPAYKRYFGLGLKAVFIAETIGFAVSYGLWFKLNSDRDFRLYMHNNYFWVLDGYYTIGEKIGGIRTRELDRKIWANEGKI